MTPKTNFQNNKNTLYNRSSKAHKKRSCQGLLPKPGLSVSGLGKPNKTVILNQDIFRRLFHTISISDYQLGRGTVMQLMLPPRSCHRASIADLAWRSVTRRSTRMKMRRHVHSVGYSDNAVRILPRLLCFSCRYQDLQVPICSSPCLVGTIRLDYLWLLDHSVPPHYTKAQRRGGVDLKALRRPEDWQQSWSAIGLGKRWRATHWMPFKLFLTIDV